VYAWDSQTVKPLAAVSYALCLAEIIEQAERMEFAPDALYVCSAGSTGAGLVLGKAALGQSLMIRNIAPIEWPWDTQADMARIAEEAAALLGLNLRFERSDIDVTFDYLGPGYGKVSPGCLEAMALLARTEGILLDPIYSGKALAGLIDHVRRGKLTAEQNVVFVHTGGTPAIFAYNTELGQGIAARRM
jgi:1-aminocyclopropane-1-carboxylate deaminase/D-cysteine desulfhydrase-like pyridoxal-dependent ACC family enzyme